MCTDAENTESLEACGFTADEALPALEPLIAANISSIPKNGAVCALTGPSNDVTVKR